MVLVTNILISIAYIDFAESEEIEDDVLEIVRGNVTNLIDDFERHLSNARVGERLREGVHLAIVGEPNVGKSSLLNFLVQRPAAIVSATAGTTREPDIVEMCPVGNVQFSSYALHTGPVGLVMI